MRMHIAVVLAGLAQLAGLAAAPVSACVHLGLEAGLNESKATLHSDLGFPPEPGYRPAWSAGLMLDAPLTPRLSLATGLRYIEYGEQIRISFVTTGGGARFERHLIWRYLAVPLQARLRPFAARGLYLAAGPEAGYLLTVWHQDQIWAAPSPFQSTVATRADGPASTIFEQLGTFDAGARGDYSSMNLAFAGALGWEFPLGRHTGLAEARYTHGFTDIAKAQGIERYTRGLELMLGARW
jgi:hypothetical protein